MGMPYVSDHAVLRYLERAYGLDVEKIRREMQTPTLEIAASFGGEVIGRNGVRFVIGENGCVTTVLPRRERGRRR